ncbi:pentatricopeptide repeat-containing protein At1g55630-like isoform X1 [Quercus lobata]|uniref:Pentatricopeptide repeat-containing protein n=2 Tax=Quercus lobata TaxID=97700 RepID=A0A7N2MH38_QUELO|nr:pentatricopeptide repeat-containing protein At1g55630-like isoform X1 [Quercus lobata]
MEIPSLYKKLRYFSNSCSVYSLFSHSPHPFLSPKTLVSPSSSPEIFFISNHFHFHTKPTSSSLYPLISSSGSSLFSAITCPIPQSSQNLHFYSCNNNEYRHQFWNLGLVKPCVNRFTRWFSVSSKDVSSGSAGLSEMNSIKNVKFRKMGVDGIRPKPTRKQVSEIIGLVMRDENDLESKLDSMNVNLSIDSITEVFWVLNFERVSALRFFNWIRGSRPDLYCNSDICSLVIDNCGWLDDHKAMLCILNELRKRKICLNKKAFGFLPVLVSNKESIMHSVRRVVEVLKEVGGSCRNSGIYSLIEMFVSLGSFEMAEFVMEITERKAVYYNVLVREKCRRCDFEGAREVLDEMRLRGCCDRIVIGYNYLLSSLCKNDKTVEASQVLEEIQVRDWLPDALTFEIFICYSFRLGKPDLASQFLDRMVSNGVEPRHSTHAAFIKGYFSLLKYEEAYKYVVDSSVKLRFSSNLNYSLLASLHQKKGNVVIARNILLEMIKKGLRPNFAVYMRVLRHLNNAGREDLARDLKSSFSSLSLQPSLETG